MSLSIKRTPVIIDTDPGVDDIIAILLALASPEIEILAFIVSFGNTDIESSYRNVLKAYQAVSRHIEQNPSLKEKFPNFSPDVKPILARGCSGPLLGDLHSAQYFHGRDGLGNITERHPDLNVDLNHLTEIHPQLNFSQKSGVEVAIEIIKSRPAKTVTYIALGPLSNLAQIMRSDATLIHQRIGRIICMGGALDVPGNTSPVAEFNFFADPFAVKELLIQKDHTSLLPLDRFLLLPLDITTPHELRFPVYQASVDQTFVSSVTPSDANQKSPLVHFTSSFLERTREVMLQFGKDAMELHDIVAVWCAIENPPSSDDNNMLAPGWQTKRKVFDIERFGELTRGMLVVDRRGEQLAYAPGSIRTGVLQDLEDTIQRSRIIPAQVEIEQAPSPSEANIGQGVLCVVKTPGPETLLHFLLDRLWGCRPQLS